MTAATSNTIHQIERSIHDFTSMSHLKASLGDTTDEEHLLHAAWKLENFDAATSVPNVNDPDAEARRLQNLLEYNILDSHKPNEELDELTLEAQTEFNAPYAAISLIDFGRQWFQSVQGLEGVTETSRELAFCAHTIRRKPDCGVLVVPDATQDERFAANPFVAGGLSIRFYAGAPIRSPEGHVLGALCIIDTQPRPQGLTVKEKELLQNLANCAMATILLSMD